MIHQNQLVGIRIYQEGILVTLQKEEIPVIQKKTSDSGYQTQNEKTRFIWYQTQCQKSSFGVRLYIQRYLQFVSDATPIELNLHLVSDATSIKLRCNWYQTQQRQSQIQAPKFNLHTSRYQILESSFDYLQLLKMVSDLAHNCQGQKIITFGYQMWPMSSAKETPIKLWYINQQYQVSSFDSTSSCDDNKVLRWRHVFKSNYDKSRWSQSTYLNSRFKIIKYETQGEFLKTSSKLINSVAILLDENCSSKS